MRQERSTISRDTTSSTTGLRQVMTTKVSNRRVKVRAAQAPPAKVVMKRLIWESSTSSKPVISKKLGQKQSGRSRKQKKRKGCCKSLARISTGIRSLCR
jgi:hypothetical protein